MHKMLLAFLKHRKAKAYIRWQNATEDALSEGASAWGKPRQAKRRFAFWAKLYYWAIGGNNGHSN